MKAIFGSIFAASGSGNSVQEVGGVPRSRELAGEARCLAPLVAAAASAHLALR
jgi:hypothetical protein